ncbi:tetratricopeptide repeat protein [Sphingobacterium sp.]|uniref:tetratricopeptide repeat protein n=1 Tax=Sphingobacterium sp. TaxID=341027 RepID=UPI00289FCB13|nr:tetratricopeptide repeat protein [Sphingobacterium sp.]
MKKILSLIVTILLCQSLIAQTVEELNALGIKYAKKEKFDEAFSAFDKAINLYPNSPGTYVNRGNIHRFRGNYDLAIADYSKFLDFSPKNIDVLYARAGVYKEVAAFDKAIFDYSRVIEIDPSYTDIYFDRAYSYIRLKDYVNAKNDLIAQLKISPKDFKSLANLINVKKELKLFDEAIMDYDKLLNEFPNQQDLHILYNNRANLYRETNRPKEALVEIEKALKLNRNYAIGYFNRASIHLDLGDASNACKDFKKALSLNLQKDPHFEVDEDFEKLKSLCNVH